MKAVCVTGRLVLALVSAIAGVQTAETQSAAVSGAPKAEDVFKNIQALKGLPADQLRPTMMLFSAALGVACIHCHVVATGVRREARLNTAPDAEYRSLLKMDGGQPSWWYSDPDREVDTPKKQMARMMIRMVGAINKENFGGRQVVTCFTCHRGSPHPVRDTAYDATTVPAPSATVSEAERSAISATSADQLLDRFLAAIGGVAAIQKISTRVAKGTMQSAVLIGEGEGGGGPRPPLAVEILSKAPAMRTVVIRQGNGVVRSFNGDAGWHQNRFSDDLRHQPRDLTGNELDNEKMEDPYFFAGQLRQLVSEQRVARVEKVGGKEAYVVVGRTRYLPEVQLYFDRESGMLVRLLALTQTMTGRLSNQWDYADFRTVDGVKVPFRWIHTELGDRAVSTYQMDQVQHNIPVEESKWVKPSRYLNLFPN